MPVLRSGSFRVLYIHVPKTGGTYVEELLRSYGDLHGIKYGHDPLPLGFRCTPQHFHGRLLECLYSKDVWEPVSYFDYVFMTVRHPIDRLISEYKYQNRTFIHENHTERPSFWEEHLNQWCRYGLEWVRDDPFYMDNHFRPQHEFEAFSPEIFHIEDGYEAIKARLNELTGMSGTLPEDPMNVSMLPYEDISLDEETTELVRSFYAEDFSRYGYMPS